MDDQERDKLKISGNLVVGGRKWIKLWVDPWLDGTTRYMNTGSERAFWVDLLAEAGRSRFPGYICPGIEHGEFVGYPLAWYQAKQPDIDALATLKKFESQEKIALTTTCQNPVSLVVKILNWDKYQSPIDDATRAKMSRDRKKNKSLNGASRKSVTDRHDESSRSDRTRSRSRSREEGDGEAEAEALRAKVAAAAPQINSAFELLNASPYGPDAFQLEWLAAVQSSPDHEGDVLDQDQSHRIARLPDCMERCIQNCNRNGIHVPAPFFNRDKRMAEARAAPKKLSRTERNFRIVFGLPLK